MDLEDKDDKLTEQEEDRAILVDHHYSIMN
jgi:hypothetical protein